MMVYVTSKLTAAASITQQRATKKRICRSASRLGVSAFCRCAFWQCGGAQTLSSDAPLLLAPNSGALLLPRRQRADPKGMARALGCGRERRWRAAGKRCNNSGGWVCGAGCGPCAAARLRVCGHGVGGVAKAKNACRTRAVAAVEAASPPATSAGQPTVCVCAPHSPAHFAGCAAREAGPGAGVGEKGARTRHSAGGSGPPHPRVCACDRRAGGGRAPWSPREMRVAAQPQVWRTGAVPADEKSSNWSSRAGRPGGEPEACVSTGARVPREGASAQRRARARSKKERKRRPAEGAPTAEEAHRMHAGPTLPALFKTTRCAQSPRRRACCKVFRLRRPLDHPRGEKNLMALRVRRYGHRRHTVRHGAALAPALAHRPWPQAPAAASSPLSWPSGSAGWSSHSPHSQSPSTLGR